MIAQRTPEPIDLAELDKQYSRIRPYCVKRGGDIDRRVYSDPDMQSVLMAYPALRRVVEAAAALIDMDVLCEYMPYEHAPQVAPLREALSAFKLPEAG